MNLNSPFSISNQKIDPTRRRITTSDFLPDGTPNNYDRVEIGPTDLAFEEWAAAGLTAPKMPAIRAYRHSRIVQQLQERDYAAVLMFDPLNIRYATDTSNMQIWITHNAGRACMVCADGHMVLWDFHGGEHLSAHLPLVKEVRHGASFFYFESGDRSSEHAEIFCRQVDEVLREHCGDNRRLAIDKMEIEGVFALQNLGIDIKNGQEVTEYARLVKSPDEQNAMQCAIYACEQACNEMRSIMRPGISEADMWAELNRGNHIRGGEWIETRILSSGPRTNPWFQEAGPRILRDGDILAFDTDMVGTYGYCSDISRTWKVGNQKPTDYEKDIYKIAFEHIQTNIELLKPGVSYRELTEKAHRLPEQFRHQRYGVVYHGVGLCDEFPAIRYPEDVEDFGYAGVLQEGHCICVEVYVGEVGGPCGIKLEDQGVVTADGFRNMTTLPFEDDFLQ